MYITEEDFPIVIDSGLLPDNAGQVLFFDIETTGFSGQSALIYLIGCIFYQEKIWRIRQWFLDNTDSEQEMLLSFFDFISSYKWLIHFNGTAFDIPFIEKRLQHYHLAQNFSAFQSLDLYREIRIYKKPLGLSGMKQKNLEEYLGIHRADPFHGGELIEVYNQYLETHKKELTACLLLHNADDLRGMLSILPLYGLTLFLQGNFIIEETTVYSATVCFSLKTPLSLPAYISLTFGGSLLTVEKSCITATVPLLIGNLKYFYSNYKDYYYLPEEDRAIHKSVAIYVDKSFRKAATPSTCYNWRKGSFLPLISHSRFSVVFRKNYKDKECYLELTEEFLLDKEMQKTYLLHLFQTAEN